jgi:MOSC domain-containing protein YiiM
MEPPLTLPVLSVNVGLPAFLGVAHGERIISGIAKRPVSEPTILVGPTNLAGDGQADLSVHGGPDKAVYAYCSTHWPAWLSEYGLPGGAGRFGENLTLAGPDESQVHIGDVFAWGTVRLAVSQPRLPCFKLALYLGRNDIGAAMVKTGRSGFYLRVLEGGNAPTHDIALTRCQHETGAPTIRGLYAKYFDPKAAADELMALAATPGLAAAWQENLKAKARARR